MKKALLGFLFIFLSWQIFSAPITPNIAKRTAKGFIIKNLRAINTLNPNSAFSSNFTLTQTFPNENIINSPYYIFKINQAGFIIIAGDDASMPVLGYSIKNNFDNNNQPIQLKKWMDNINDQIDYIRANKITASPAITANWFGYINAHKALTNSKIEAIQGVTPLVTAKWDQAPYYNALCPYDNGAIESTVTGCVATAMAQLMKFWNFPVKGSGFRSFNHPKYGTLSANFGNTTYQWGSMPNSISSSNSAIATLIYHCGVSVDMEYGIGANGGSSAYPTAIPTAFTNYFGYSTSASLITRSNFTTTAWKQKLITELDAGRPMEYHGFGNGGGHSFVCDGYDNSGFFHFNWGWSGVGDGFYSIDALNPTALGYGGGLGSYNSGQGAVIGIKPPVVVGGVYNLALNSNLAISPSATIYHQNPFSVQVGIANSGTGSFNGDYTAAIFRSDGTFIDYIETKTNLTLAAGNNTTLTFSNTGLYAATPGTYSIYIYSRVSGGNWTAISNGSFSNIGSLTVLGVSGGLQMYSSITVSPSTIVANQNFNISFDVANFGANLSNGYISADLHNSNGDWIKTINENTSVTLNNGFYISMNFNANTLNVPPGSYLIAIWGGTDSPNSEVVGNANYNNPILVNIIVASDAADSYESNNTSNTAFTFSPTFATSTETITTVGSTLHNGADLDFYSIDLPSGQDYTIDARVHDSYSSGNSNTYTADVMFSYDNGAGLSSAYDDVLPQYLYSYNGGNIKFLIAPYFSGEKGTYLLDVTIYEGIISSTKNELESKSMSIYPNPSSSLITISGENISSNNSNITIQDISGQIVLNTTKTTIDISDIAPGLYTMTLETNNKIYHKKLTITR